MVQSKEPKPEPHRRGAQKLSPVDGKKREVTDKRPDQKIDEKEDDSDQEGSQISREDNIDSNENQDNISDDDDDGAQPLPETIRSIHVNEKHIPSPSRSWPTQNPVFIVVILTILGSVAYSCLQPNNDSNLSLNDKDWRSKVDPDDTLSDNQRFTVLASLKPILDSSSKQRQEGVSTLLILSSNEKSAAKLARCLLKLVNTKTRLNKLSTEINLRSHPGGKLQLDSDLKSLLGPDDVIRAVLLRHIDDNSSNDAIEQLRLLFAYCDGENPVIPHRLIIMTATSDSTDENGLRTNFKNSWPSDHDFVDALMARISGHTVYVHDDQKSIC